MSSKGFVFMESYYDAMEELEPEDRHALLDAILDYVFRDKEPDLEPMQRMAFKLIRPNIDASLARYSANVENGKKGGRPKGAKNPTKTQKKPKQNQDMEKDKDKDLVGSPPLEGEPYFDF